MSPAVWVRLPPQMLRKIDARVDAGECTTRSEAIRRLIAASLEREDGR